MIVLPEQYVVQTFYQHVSHPTYNRLTRTYNGTCPFCKEGKSFGKKKRFFYLPKIDKVYCHNCGYSKGTLKFVLDVTGKPYNVVIDEVKSDDYTMVNLNEITELKKEPEVEVKTLPDDCINLLDKTQIEFYKGNPIVRTAFKFMLDRRLITAVNRPDTFYLSLVDKTHKNRLVIPFYDTQKKIVFYQTRTLLDKDNFTRPKYLSKVGGVKSLYGIHSIKDDIDNVYLLEGPIDSFFVKNGIAVGGIQDESEKLFNERQAQQIATLTTYNKIWLLDNQRCDVAALKKSEILLNMGESVFIWPEELSQYKDVNEYCIDKQCDEFDQKIILGNVYQGLEGLVKLQMLRR